jgi:hypothetical protein
MERATLIDLIAARPVSTDHLADDCLDSKSNPVWRLPLDRKALDRELAALVRAGVVEERQGRWHILPPKPAKAERALF